MNKLLRLLVAIFFGIAAFVLIKQTSTIDPTDDMIGMANPASVFCIEQWWVINIIDQEDGQVGICTLPDGTVCEERAFLRGECTKQNILVVDDFLSCEAAGNAVMESYPRQCIHDGTLFIEDIEYAEWEDIIVCTREYLPVCARITLHDGSYEEETFGNRCMMDTDKRAVFLHEGECVDPK